MLQLHVSGLTTLSRCGIQFERRYLQGQRTPTSVCAAVGLAVDKSVSTNMVHKRDFGDLLPLEQINDTARDSLVNEWERVEVQPEDTDEGIECSRDRAIDRSVKLAGFHHSTVAPTIHPTHVQRSWTLDIEGLPLQLAGTIDLQEGLDRIRDTKTSAKSPVKTLADTSLQLTTYALAVHAHDHGMVNRVGLDYLVMTPKREEKKVVQLESTRTQQDFAPLLERVYQAHRQIESGIFTPAAPDHWACSRRYCAFWETCRFAVRPVSLAMAA